MVLDKLEGANLPLTYCGPIMLFTYVNSGTQVTVNCIGLSEIINIVINKVINNFYNYFYFLLLHYYDIFCIFVKIPKPYEHDTY